MGKGRRVFLQWSLLWVFVFTQDVRAVTFKTPLTLGSATFQVAVAHTPHALEKGLMGVTHLEAHQGMLFLFDKEREATFWMKDTPLPLDLAFFTKTGEIVLLAHLTPHARTPVSSPQKVMGAIELPQGTFARHRITLGARIASPALP